MKELIQKFVKKSAETIAYNSTNHCVIVILSETKMPKALLKAQQK